MIYDITDRVAEAWNYYDEMLDQRIQQIAELAGVEPEHFVKINPAEFIEKNRYQKIRGYQYQDIGAFIEMNKTDNGTFLISPLDAIEETAAQCAYKSNENIRRTLRASKCEVYPVPVPVAKDFFIRNHRQSVPNVTKQAVSPGPRLPGRACGGDALRHPERSNPREEQSLRAFEAFHQQRDPGARRRQ